MSFLAAQLTGGAGGSTMRLHARFIGVRGTASILYVRILHPGSGDSLSMGVSSETVLVTGATSGLGRAAALHLAERGYRVFAAGRSSERRAALETTARERQLALTAIEMDVREDESVDRAMAQIEEAGARVDVLINNAGVAYVVPVEEIRMADLREQFEINVFGSVRVTQRVLPKMRARGGGRIINMSSLAGRLAFPLFGAYSGSKFALEGMTDALRLEVYPFGIDVVLIEPGYIPTAMEQTTIELGSRYRENLEHGPYANVYRNFIRAWRRGTSGTRTTAEDCARVVLRAVRETPPRTRYTVTPGSQLMLWGKRLLPEGLRDRLMRRTFDLKRGDLRR